MIYGNHRLVDDFVVAARPQLERKLNHGMAVSIFLYWTAIPVLGVHLT